MGELESGDTGNIIEQAEQFVREFEDSLVEMTPAVSGTVLTKRHSALLNKLNSRHLLLLST